MMILSSTIVKSLYCITIIIIFGLRIRRLIWVRKKHLTLFGRRCHNQGELYISVAKRCKGIVVFLNSYNSGGKTSEQIDSLDNYSRPCLKLQCGGCGDYWNSHHSQVLAVNLHLQLILLTQILSSFLELQGKKWLPQCPSWRIMLGHFSMLKPASP